MTEPLRILLLEDDEDDYLITRKLLHGAYPYGFTLNWARSFNQAVVLAAEQFDLYLVDYRLGEKNGIDWLIGVQEQLGVQTPAAILLTGAGGEEADMLASKAGFSDFISKTGLTASLLERSIRYARHHHQLIGQLASSRAGYKQLYDSSFDGILLANAEGIILNSNPSAEALLGYSHAELVGGSLLRLIPDRFHHGYLIGMRTLVETGESRIKGKPTEVSALHSNGSEIPMEVVINVISNGEEIHFSANLRNIAERKHREEVLEYHAHNDPLTGMYNRRRLLEKMEEELKRARRFDHQLSLLMLDIDHFKHVNDTYGHAAGDEVLKCVAGACVEKIRSIDIAGRWGGEEFMILLPETDVDGGVTIAEKIREAVSTCTTSYEEQKICVTISIGITCLLEEDTTTIFFKRADQALYHAKESGRNRVSQSTNLS